MSLVLFGLRKSGKRYYGTLLAKKLGYMFHDTDDMIERQYLMENGEKIVCRQIYQVLGSEQFRFIERKAIRGLHYVRHAVISVGNSILLDPISLSQLSKIGPFIFLRSKQKQHIETPSLLEHVYESHGPHHGDEPRLPSYMHLSIHHVDIDTKTEEEILNEIEQLELDFIQAKSQEA